VFRFLSIVGSTLLLAAAQAPPPPSDMTRQPAGKAAPAPDFALFTRFGNEYRQSSATPRPVFERYLPTLGAAAMLDFLEATYPQCHGQAHDLGKAIMAREQSLAVALEVCGNRCTSGCMHGAIAEAFGSEDLALLVQKMNGFCLSDEMKSYQPGNCAHALGHAFMLITARSIPEALNACLYFDLEPMRFYCAGGVFMEAIDGSEAPRQWPSTLAPCDAHPQFPAACFRYRLPHLFAEFGGNLANVARLCQDLEPAQRRGCYHGLGALVRTTPHRIAQTCGGGNAEEQTVCIEGAIEKLADFDDEASLTLCATLPAGMADACREATRGGMYRLDKPTNRLYYDAALVGERRPLPAPAHAHHDHH
jgi:hypothetical protein